MCGPSLTEAVLPEPVRPTIRKGLLIRPVLLFTQPRLVLTSNGNSITTHGFDAQTTIAPFSGLFITTGYQYHLDFSSDFFNRFNTDTGRVPDFTTLTRGASTPDTEYENNALFLQAEFDRFKIC